MAELPFQELPFQELQFKTKFRLSNVMDKIINYPINHMLDFVRSKNLNIVNLVRIYTLSQFVEIMNEHINEIRDSILSKYDIRKKVENREYKFDIYSFERDVSNRGHEFLLELCSEIALYYLSNYIYIFLRGGKHLLDYIEYINYFFNTVIKLYKLDLSKFNPKLIKLLELKTTELEQHRDKKHREGEIDDTPGLIDILIQLEMTKKSETELESESELKSELEQIFTKLKSKVAKIEDTDVFTTKEKYDLIKEISIQSGDEHAGKKHKQRNARRLSAYAISRVNARRVSAYAIRRVNARRVSHKKRNAIRRK